MQEFWLGVEILTATLLSCVCCGFSLCTRFLGLFRGSSLGGGGGGGTAVMVGASVQGL